MIGAIAGDVIGSVFEGRPVKTTDFPLFSPRSTFTDDTVLTVAVAFALLHDGSYGAALKSFARRYPQAGYGGTFYQWMLSEATHNHPEGIKGAQATALAVFMARNGASKDDIRRMIGRQFGYDLDRSLDALRPAYRFDVSCQGSVPESIIAFLESEDYEDAVRKTVSLGGDSDTRACIAGGIAQAYYNEVPGVIVSTVRAQLPADLLHVVDSFSTTFGV